MTGRRDVGASRASAGARGRDVGLTDILNTARDAMAAQTFGLTVTGQNVSNVNTPGYVRRQALLETRDMGDRNFGSVHIAGLRRVGDEFVEQRHLALVGLSAEAASRDQLLSQTEALFNDIEGTGLGGSLSALFSSFSAVASLPTDLTTRSSLLQRAQTFADQVRGTSEQLQSFRTELFSQARELTDQINAKVDTIASLSGRINQAQAVGEEPADLKDKRDAALLELSELVEIRTYTDGNGQLVVQGPGATLVQGDTARHLGVDLDNDGNLKILAKTPSGGGDVTAFLSAGQLSGIVQVRDGDVVEMLANLDQFAFHVAGQINAVHAAGFGLDGNGGRALFTLGSGVSGAAASLRLNADLEGQPELVAASTSATALPGDGGQATLLARVAETPIGALGNLDPSQAYARLVGRVGQRKSDAAGTLATREAMTAQVEVVRQSISGVSLDEEMVNLTKYQRAFEAASRVFTTADRLLEDLINTLGR
jgi:flagellar hook-associated protein 1